MVKNTAIPFYEIRVRGVLGDTLVHAFPGLTGSKEGTNTVLSGELPDQAALYGVLLQIESLGLELQGVLQVTRP
jgi:hypothetical protein